ncbi:MAG: hypothetical protein ABWK05_03115 [Pyrobaculum sp.]
MYNKKKAAKIPSSKISKNEYYSPYLAYLPNTLAKHSGTPTKWTTAMKSNNGRRGRHGRGPMRRRRLVQRNGLGPEALGYLPLFELTAV